MLAVLPESSAGIAGWLVFVLGVLVYDRKTTTTMLMMYASVVVYICASGIEAMQRMILITNVGGKTSWTDSIDEVLWVAVPLLLIAWKLRKLWINRKSEADGVPTSGGVV